jgi:hypothetical protein
VTCVRLHVLVEGQTEEGFVNRILGPELAGSGVFADAHRITTGRRRGEIQRGGFVQYDHLARDLSLWMKQDQGPESWFTTMVDFYRLPTDFPGLARLSRQLPAADRIKRLEAALADDMTLRLNTLPVCNRFIPYIQLHEFEALLFSAPAAFVEAFPGDEALVTGVAAIRSQFKTPEDIDESPKTAPSKRILSLARDYQKPVAGLLIAERIGLATMRSACPHFDEWLTRLSSLAGS